MNAYVETLQEELENVRLSLLEIWEKRAEVEGTNSDNYASDSFLLARRDLLIEEEDLVYKWMDLIKQEIQYYGKTRETAIERFGEKNKFLGENDMTDIHGLEGYLWDLRSRLAQAEIEVGKIGMEINIVGEPDDHTGDPFSVQLESFLIQEGDLTCKWRDLLEQEIKKTQKLIAEELIAEIEKLDVCSAVEIARLRHSIRQAVVEPA